MTDTLEWLMAWYAAQCDGDWEHDYGVTIDTLDNPGWSVKINLVGTDLEQRLFEELNQNSDLKDGWLHCRVKGGCFVGHGGPSDLEAILNVFRSWATLP